MALRPKPAWRLNAPPARQRRIGKCDCAPELSAEKAYIALNAGWSLMEVPSKPINRLAGASLGFLFLELPITSRAC